MCTDPYLASLSWVSTWLLSSGSLTIVIAWLLVGGIGIPLPEEVALIAAGALVYHGVVPVEVVLPCLIVTLMIADFTLFQLARHLGDRLLQHRVFQRLLPAARRARVEAAYKRHGGRLVFVARHVAGLRGATFALAGILGMPARRFLAWDGLAACSFVPITVGLGYGFALHLDRVRRDVTAAEHWLVLAALIVLLGYIAFSASRRRFSRA